MDAVALVVRRSDFEIRGQRNVYLNSAERVALLLWLQHKGTGKHLLVANTHLSFPHTALDRIFQMRQVSSLVTEMDAFEAHSGLASAASTRIILGDFNVESHSPVCAHLRQAGYVSGLGTVLGGEGAGAGAGAGAVAGGERERARESEEQADALLVSGPRRSRPWTPLPAAAAAVAAAAVVVAAVVAAASPHTHQARAGCPTARTARRTWAWTTCT